MSQGKDRPATKRGLANTLSDGRTALRRTDAPAADQPIAAAGAAAGLDSLQVAKKVMNFLLLLFACSRSQNHAQQCLDITPKAFMVLFMLRYHPDQNLTMSELAAQLNMSKQQLTKLVGALEEKGLVVREHDQNNRRLVFVHLSAPGRQSLDSALEHMLFQSAPVFDLFTGEEKEQICASIDVLERLLERIRYTNW